MISIIIPTYNRAELLSKCINSLIKQDYPKNKYEIIVVDDGSSDNTKELAENFIKKYKNIQYINHPKNRGVAASRNTGIKKAKGDLFAFLDNDCIASKNFLKNIDFEFNNGNILCLQGKINLVYSNILTKTIHLNFRRTSIYTPNFVIRRKIFNKIGLFDENLTRGVDVDYGIRLKNHYKIYYNDNVIVNHYHRYDITNFLFYYKNLGKSLFYIDKKNNKLGLLKLIRFVLGGFYDSIIQTLPQPTLFPTHLLGILINRYYYLISFVNYKFHL